MTENNKFIREKQKENIEKVEKLLNEASELMTKMPTMSEVRRRTVNQFAVDITVLKIKICERLK